MYRDRFTGFHHTHYRDFDPVHDRWLSPDSAGYKDGLNLYGAYKGVDGVDPLGLVMILIHGVNTDAAWFEHAKAGLRAYWKAHGMPEEEIIEFKWWDEDGVQGGSSLKATDDTTKFHGYNKAAAERLSILIAELDGLKKRTGSEENISIMAHSQGTEIAMFAMDSSYIPEYGINNNSIVPATPTKAKIDNFIMMGSPYDITHFGKYKKFNKLSSIQSDVRGNVYNYRSKDDFWASFKGIIGANGNYLNR
ncbi:hypothetical protein KS4_29790 [Poriferisphaera corsica]|uniref:T6SS Tle3 phospholipase effector alpha/beta domain-containing protein n=2 Tax=Poriferisphaera corsica TaxID=2528020 RepID=A0A517YXE8_9BACT|nr:hypothetical protein KS4_29790 [Poriferisphaera corsica]